MSTDSDTEQDLSIDDLADRARAAKAAYRDAWFAVRWRPSPEARRVRAEAQAVLEHAVGALAEAMTETDEALVDFDELDAEEPF